jgi:hypothetical protein
MNSRKRRQSVEALDFMIRDSLRDVVQAQHPSVLIRRRLVRRAADRLRRSRHWFRALVPTIPGEPYALWSGFALGQLNYINIQLAVRSVGFSFYQLR